MSALLQVAKMVYCSNPYPCPCHLEYAYQTEEHNSSNSKTALRKWHKQDSFQAFLTSSKRRLTHLQMSAEYILLRTGSAQARFERYREMHTFRFRSDCWYSQYHDKQGLEEMHFDPPHSPASASRLSISALPVCCRDVFRMLSKGMRRTT